MVTVSTLDRALKLTKSNVSQWPSGYGASFRFHTRNTKYWFERAWGKHSKCVKMYEALLTAKIVRIPSSSSIFNFFPPSIFFAPEIL